MGTVPGYATERLSPSTRQKLYDSLKVAPLALAIDMS